jgi:hypothetical protein
MEQFYQGSKDVFLAGVRAKFDAVEQQAVRAVSSLEQNGLLNSDTNTDGLFSEVSNVSDEGNRVIWRHVSVAGLQQMGSRVAGGSYPEGEFPRGWETIVADPNLQDATKFTIPEERLDAEGKKYKQYLDRAQLLVLDARRKNIGDPFDVFNQAFILPSAYASAKFNAKGNMGLDGNYTALGERLITITHKIAMTNAATSPALSNCVVNSGNHAAFNDTYYYAAKEQFTGFVDDVGKPMPMGGGTLTLVVPNANSLVRTAQEINKSDWKVGTANNEVNVLQSTVGRIIASPYLTNSINYSTANTQNKKWFLVDTSAQMPEVGTGLVRVCFVPTNSRVEPIQGEDAVAYKLKQSYSYAFVDWRNMIGSLGDNTAAS